MPKGAWNSDFWPFGKHCNNYKLQEHSGKLFYKSHARRILYALQRRNDQEHILLCSILTCPAVPCPTPTCLSVRLSVCVSVRNLACCLWPVHRTVLISVCLSVYLSTTLPVTSDLYTILYSYLSCIFLGSSTFRWHQHWPPCDVEFDLDPMTWD